MRQVSAGARTVIGWLGWLGFLVLIVTVIALVTWWNWDQGRALPLPPDARNVTTDNAGTLAKVTRFVVTTPVADVRAFYREALPQRGWVYCGTQDTPGCTNLTNVGGEVAASTDVYRRADDPSSMGTTIEVWPTQNPNGETHVTVYEANNFRGS